MTYGPPPAPPPPAPWAPKPRRNTRTILLVVGAVVVLCCGGLIAGGFFVVRTFVQGTQPVRDAAHGFITDLEDGDYAGAYDQLCGTIKTSWSESDFTQQAQAPGQISDYRITGTSVSRDLVAGSTGEITAEVSFDSGETVEWLLPMVEESGGWRVCGDPF